MKTFVAVCCVLVGAVYLLMGLRDGVAEDKAGVPLARRRKQPFAFWSLMALYTSLIAVGVFLLVAPHV